MTTKAMKPQYRTIRGKRMVVLPQDDFENRLRKADLWEPELPQPDERGLYPLSVLAIIQARDILRARRKLGLSQAAPASARKLSIGSNTAKTSRACRRLPRLTGH
jgi:hypothetical protein